MIKVFKKFKRFKGLRNRMQIDNNQQVFFALLRGGLWGQEVCLSKYREFDFSVIMRMAEEQSVVGLITAGLEQVTDVKIPQEWTLQFIGQTLQIEQRNRAMNEFVSRLIEKLRKEDVYAILVKGQGIAQCYERPLWRSCGDVDLFLSDGNYQKAKEILLPMASSIEEEDSIEKHLGFIINSWTVELHGTLRSRCLGRMDEIIDEAQRDVFYGGNVRSWTNDNVQIFLPAPNEDVFFVFTHIIKHFFHGGIGLRQICDWCRLLWIYRDSLNHGLLEQRIRNAGLMTEWKSFSALAVDYLGIQKNAIPLYSPGRKWSKKAEKVLKIILETGNFGHNVDRSYIVESGKLKRKLTTLWRVVEESVRNFRVFPIDSIRVWFNLFRKGLGVLVKGQR